MQSSAELDRATALEEVASLDTRRWIDTVIVDSQYGAAENDATCDDEPAASGDDLEAWARHASAANGFGEAAMAVRAAKNEFGDAATYERPTSYDLHRAARAHRAAVLGEVIAAAIGAVGAIARRAYAAYRRRRVANATYRALNELDDRALRDLGLDRSELGSVVAEQTGRAERTRVRTMWALS